MTSYTASAIPEIQTFIAEKLANRGFLDVKMDETALFTIGRKAREEILVFHAPIQAATYPDLKELITRIRQAAQENFAVLPKIRINRFEKTDYLSIRFTYSQPFQTLHEYLSTGIPTVGQVSFISPRQNPRLVMGLLSPLAAWLSDPQHATTADLHPELTTHHLVITGGTTPTVMLRHFGVAQLMAVLTGEAAAQTNPESDTQQMSKIYKALFTGLPGHPREDYLPSGHPLLAPIHAGINQESHLQSVKHLQEALNIASWMSIGVVINRVVIALASVITLLDIIADTMSNDIRAVFMVLAFNTIGLELGRQFFSHHFKYHIPRNRDVAMMIGCIVLGLIGSIPLSLEVVNASLQAEEALRKMIDIHGYDIETLKTDYITLKTTVEAELRGNPHDPVMLSLLATVDAKITQMPTSGSEIVFIPVTVTPQPPIGGEIAATAPTLESQTGVNMVGDIANEMPKDNGAPAHSIGSVSDNGAVAISYSSAVSVIVVETSVPSMPQSIPDVNGTTTPIYVYVPITNTPLPPTEVTDVPTAAPETTEILEITATEADISGIATATETATEFPTVVLTAIVTDTPPTETTTAVLPTATEMLPTATDVFPTMTATDMPEVYVEIGHPLENGITIQGITETGFWAAVFDGAGIRLTGNLKVWFEIYRLADDPRLNPNAVPVYKKDKPEQESAFCAFGGNDICNWMSHTEQSGIQDVTPLFANGIYILRVQAVLNDRVVSEWAYREFHLILHSAEVHPIASPTATAPLLDPIQPIMPEPSATFIIEPTPIIMPEASITPETPPIFVPAPETNAGENGLESGGEHREGHEQPPMPPAPENSTPPNNGMAQPPAPPISQPQPPPVPEIQPHNPGNHDNGAIPAQPAIPGQGDTNTIPAVPAQPPNNPAVPPLEGAAVITPLVPPIAGGS